MASPNDLAAQMDNMRLHAEETNLQQTHVLRFKFPAVELLSPGMYPYFEPPADINTRQRPTESSCQMNVLDTNFFTVFKVVEEESTCDAINIAFEDYQNLMKAIEELKLRPGASCLQAVVYNSDHGTAASVKLRYRFRLLTDAYGSGEVLNQDFELDADQWNCLTEFETSQDWIEVLVNLVTQDSERAVFEVRKTLTEACGTNFAKSVEDSWKYSWAEDRPRTVKEMFLARLNMSDWDRLELDAPGDAWIEAELACGHTIRIRKVQFHSFTGEACFQQKCEICGRKIMRTKDEQELSSGQEWDRLVEYRQRTEAWQELDVLPPTTEMQTLNTIAVSDALNAALQSFEMPEWVCPITVGPDTWRETELIQDVYRNTYGDKDTPITFTCSAEDLCGNLAQIAGEAVAKEGITNFAPGLEKFVNAWLLRAVNVLTHRLCTETGREHSGVHQHQHEWWFGRDGGLRTSSDADDEWNDVEERSGIQSKMEDATMEEEV